MSNGECGNESKVYRYRRLVAGGETQPVGSGVGPDVVLFDEVNKGELFRILARTADGDPVVCELLQVLTDEIQELKRLVVETQSDLESFREAVASWRVAVTEDSAQVPPARAGVCPQRRPER